MLLLQQRLIFLWLVSLVLARMDQMSLLLMPRSADHRSLGNACLASCSQRPACPDVALRGHSRSVRRTLRAALSRSNASLLSWSLGLPIQGAQCHLGERPKFARSLSVFPCPQST